MPPPRRARTGPTASTTRAKKVAVNGDGMFMFDKPIDIEFLPTMKTAKIKILDTFTKEMDKPNSVLSKLLDNPPTLDGKATQELDGSLIPIVMVVVRDKAGATRAGIGLRLVDATSMLLDRTRTDATGLALLRFPSRRGHGHGAAGGDAIGAVEVLGTKVSEQVTVPEEVQHIIVEIVVEKLPEMDTLIDLESGEVKGVSLGGDPFERLPTDFTPELCNDLTRMRGTVSDPILGKIAAPDDFRSRRTPLLKRVSMVRLGELDANDTKKPLRRYLVRLRQEWTFLGYTLGELAEIDNLDPGAIIRESTENVQRAVERVARSFERFTQDALDTTNQSLRQGSSIDTLLQVATSTKAHAAAGGFGFGIPGVFGVGAVGATAGLSTSATTRSSTRTSLAMNASLQQARSLVNESVRTALSSLRDVQSTVLRSLENVSPLLSRVTNLLRWVLYENYAVCTHIEDVVELLPVPLFEIKDADTPVFTDEDIVEYRPFFEPALIEPRLRGHFEVLRDAIADRVSGGTPVTTIHFNVDYAASVFGADLRIQIGGSEAHIQLEPGSTNARGTIHIHPTRPGQLAQAELILKARVPRFSFPFPITAELVDAIFGKGKVDVSRIRLWFNTTPAAIADMTVDPDLTVDKDTTTRTAPMGLIVPVRNIDTSKNPLFRHVNRNRAYYLGILGQAAVAIPSLREDVPQLASFDKRLWSLPIVGFEGSRVMVIRNVDKGDKFAKDLLADVGAATIVQLAAPGTYAEALQGLLSLTDAIGKIHPALLPLPAPVMPPLAMVDLTGKALKAVDAPVPVVPPIP